MTIRFMSENEMPAVCRVYEQSWKDAYRGLISPDYLDSISDGAWAGNISRAGRKNLVLVHEEQVVGTCCYCRSRWGRYVDYGQVVSLYLLPEWTGQGLGKALLNRAMDELRNEGLENVLLWVLAENARARRFYERYGFALAGEYMDDNFGGRTLREVMYVYRAAPGPQLRRPIHFDLY